MSFYFQDFLNVNVTTIMFLMSGDLTGLCLYILLLLSWSYSVLLLCPAILKLYMFFYRVEFCPLSFFWTNFCAGQVFGGSLSAGHTFQKVWPPLI